MYFFLFGHLCNFFIPKSIHKSWNLFKSTEELWNNFCLHQQVFMCYSVTPTSDIQHVFLLLTKTNIVSKQPGLQRE